MSDDTGARKRASGRQLTDRDDVDDGVAEVDTGVMKQADPSVIAQRRIVKARGRSATTQAHAELPKPNINWGFTAIPPVAPAPAAETAQVKETTPTKEVPAPTTETAPKEATPTKPPAAETAPKANTPVVSKEATPTKEATPSSGTPGKTEQNGEKPATPDKPANTFSGFASFSSGANPFAALSNASFPSTFPSFPSFSFTQPSPSTTGGHIFGSGFAKPKEGSNEADEEGDDGESATIPEPEPTGAPTVLPQVAVVTGEEDEETLHSVRAKLYAVEGANYKERGVGQFKINRSKDGKTRLLMRDQGGKHLRLNVAVFPEMKFEAPSDTNVRFMAFEDKKSVVFLLKVSRKDEKNELMAALEKCKGTATTTTTTKTATPEKPTTTTTKTTAST